MNSPKEIFDSNKFAIVYASYFAFFIFSIFIYLGFCILIGTTNPLSWEFYFRASYVLLEVLIFFKFMRLNYALSNKKLADGNELLVYLGIVFEKSVSSVEDSVTEDFVEGMECSYDLLMEELSKQITYIKSTQEEPTKEN